MASARYWRLVGLRTAGGGDLELFALHWYSAGTRVDAGATLTCSHAPASGTLDTLQGTNPAQTVRFAAADVRSAGFWLTWDFGTPIVDPVPRYGAVTSNRFVDAFIIQYSSDSRTWTTDISQAGVTFPGSGQFTMDAATSAERWSAVDRHASVAVSGDDDVTIGAAGMGYLNARSTTGVASGKVYFEVTCPNASGSSVAIGVGVSTSSASLGGTAGLYVGSDANGVAYYNSDGKAYRSGLPVGTGTITLFTADDVIGVGLDADARVLRFYKNGTLVWTVSSLPAGALYASVSLYNGAVARANFGTTPFKFTPPNGHSAISARTMPAVTYKARAARAAAMTLACSSSTSAPSFRSAAHARSARDMEFGGRARVYGTTKTKGSPNTPTKSRVRLLRERDGLLAREVWSDPATGEFEFTGVDAGTRWVVLAQDASGAFWPAAASSFDVEALP